MNTDWLVAVLNTDRIKYYLLRIYLLEKVVGFTECTDVMIKVIPAVLVTSLINTETVVSSFNNVPNNIEQYILISIYYLLILRTVSVGDGSNKIYSSTWGYTTDELVIIVPSTISWAVTV